MRRNQLLTKIIAGKNINATEMDESELRIQFDDGSILEARLGGTADQSVLVGVINKVNQEKTMMVICLETGTEAHIVLAAENNSVTVHSADGHQQYAD